MRFKTFKRVPIKALVMMIMILIINVLLTCLTFRFGIILENQTLIQMGYMFIVMDIVLVIHYLRQINRIYG